MNKCIFYNFKKDVGYMVVILGVLKLYDGHDWVTYVTNIDYILTCNLENYIVSTMVLNDSFSQY